MGEAPLYPLFLAERCATAQWRSQGAVWPDYVLLPGSGKNIPQGVVLWVTGL